MWDRASFSQTVFSILYVSVVVFPSFKQNLMIICCCIMTKKKNNFTHLAITNELTGFECSFYWWKVFVTGTTETSYSWLMHRKAYLHKTISPEVYCFTSYAILTIFGVQYKLWSWFFASLRPNILSTFSLLLLHFNHVSFFCSRIIVYILGQKLKCVLLHWVWMVLGRLQFCSN